jgi:hypothetical protein
MYACVCVCMHIQCLKHVNLMRGFLCQESARLLWFVCVGVCVGVWVGGLVHVRVCVYVYKARAL